MKLLGRITFYSYFLFILFSVIGMSSNYSGYISASCSDSMAEEAWNFFSMGFFFLLPIIFALYLIKSVFNDEDWSLIPFFNNKTRKIWWLPFILIVLTFLFSAFLILGSFMGCNEFYK